MYLSPVRIAERLGEQLLTENNLIYINDNLKQTERGTERGTDRQIILNLK